MQGPQAPQAGAVHRGPDPRDAKLGPVDPPGPTFPDVRSSAAGATSPTARAVPHQLRHATTWLRARSALTEGKYAPRSRAPARCITYAAMVTGPQNMPVFNDMTSSPGTGARHHRGVATFLQERVRGVGPSSARSAPCRRVCSSWDLRHRGASIGLTVCGSRRSRTDGHLMDIGSDPETDAPWHTRKTRSSTRGASWA